MPLYGVSITKTTSFRGVQQEFSNTYYYDTPVAALDSDLDALVVALVNKEQPIHAPTINFIRARCWSAGGTKATNEMRIQKTLNGVGTGAASGGYDKERAFLVRIRAGVDSRGNPVYLRKWLHLDVSTWGGDNITAGMTANTAQLGSGTRTALQTWADGIKSITAGTRNFDLKSEKGRAITGATVAHPYLEHHQLGDMWR